MYLPDGFSGTTKENCDYGCLLAILSQLKSALSMHAHQSSMAPEEHCDYAHLPALAGCWRAL